MKNSIIFLIIILILAGIISSLGINWGLPNENRIYTYKSDEMVFLMWLKNMNPSKFDFDPKVYSKTHLPIYYTAAVLKFGEIIGLYNVGNKEYYKQHPYEFRNVILLQRIFMSKIPFVILISLSFLIGKILIDDKFGILLAGVSGFLPTILVNNNYAVENILVTLLIAITFYFSLKYYKSEKLKYILLAGIFTGLSISTKQTGVLGFIFILGMLMGKRKQLGAGKIIGYLLLSGIICTLAFSITSPYYMKFLLLKTFSPATIQPDLHHGSTNIVIPFRFSLSFIGSNLHQILRINFVQLGGVLLLSVPIGFFFIKDKLEFILICIFLIVFYMLASVSVWATDNRLVPMAYFLAILGSAGIYYIIKRSDNSIYRGLISASVIISLLVYAAAIEYRFMEKDNRETSSEWIKTNILNKNDNITIGLNACPFENAPDVLSKEWMHNKYPDSTFYLNNYNETFVIPEYGLKMFGGDQILPDRELTNNEKMKWLESKSPEYVVLHFSSSYNLIGWPEYFLSSSRYKLVRYFPEYRLLGLSNLKMQSYDIYIFKKV